MRSAATGFLRIVTSPNGMTAGLGQILVIGEGNITVELVDAAGTTIYEDTIASTEVAASLGNLLEVAGCPAATFRDRAAGAYVAVDAEIRFNANGTSDEGGETLGAYPPTMGSPRRWLPEEGPYPLGWANS